MADSQAILKDYESALEDLTFNSKPIINMLTMEADKHSQLAPDLVQVVKARFFKVPQEWKLPTIYLMDSMIKNLGGPYLEELTKGIVGVFCHAFETMTDPKVRISLYKLRQTWNQYIPVRKLAAIDKHIHAIDPNWPVTAHEPSSPTIFLNPKFLETKEDGKNNKKDTIAATKNSTPPPNRKSPVNFTASLTPPTNKKSVSSQQTIPTKGVTKANSNKARSKSPLVVKNRELNSPKKSLSPPLKTTTTKAGTKRGGVVALSLSVQDKRKKLLQEQKQIRINKQVSMGILPPLQDDASLDSVLQKHKRNSSPSPQKKKKVKNSHKRPRSASPSVATEMGLKNWTIPRLTTPKEGVAGKKRTSEEPEQPSSSSKVSRIDKEDEEDDDGIKRITEGTLDLTDLPSELFKKHQKYILEQAEKRLKSGTLTTAQHEQLIKQVDQLYELQRLSNSRNKQSHDSVTSHTHDSVAHTHDSVAHTHDSVSHTHDSVSHTHDSVSHTHDSVSHSRDSVTSHTHDSVSHSNDSQQRTTLLPFPPHFPPHSRGPRHTRGGFKSRGGGGPRGERPLRGRNRPQFRDRPFRGHSPPPHLRGHSPPPHLRGHSPPPHLRGHSPPPPHLRGPSPVNNTRPIEDTTAPLPNVLDLYQKLESSGLLQSMDKQPIRVASHPLPPPPPHIIVGPPRLPVIRLNIKDLKVFRKDLHMALHEGEPCTSCGLRFRDNQREEYQKHLDWHYQENRMEKQGTRVSMRNWYLHVDDWLSFDITVRTLNLNEPLLVAETDTKEDSVGVGGGGRDEERGPGVSCQVLPGEDTQVCSVCHEQLEQFWEEDEEEWHFRDALRTPDGLLYHSYCYVDSKESQDNSSTLGSSQAVTNEPLNTVQ